MTSSSRPGPGSLPAAPVGRRRVLGAAGLVAGAALVPGASGCSALAELTGGDTDSAASSAQDTLRPLARAAAEDAASWSGATPALGEDAPRIRALGAVRAEHARRLERRIAQIGGADVSASATASPAAPDPGTSGTAGTSGAACPPLPEVRDRLRAAARTAADAAAGLTGVSAALAGSVSAGCSAVAEVVPS